MDTVALVGRLLVSLAAVLGIMWVIARRMKRGSRGKASQLIDVLGRQQLSRNASVAVVRVGEQALIIGVTDAQVSVLAETDLGAAQAMVSAATDSRRPAGHRVTPKEAQPEAKPGSLTGSALSPQTWRQTLDSLRDLTSRQA